MEELFKAATTLFFKKDNIIYKLESYTIVHGQCYVNLILKPYQVLLTFPYEEETMTCWIDTDDMYEADEIYEKRYIAWNYRFESLQQAAEDNGYEFTGEEHPNKEAL